MISGHLTNGSGQLSNLDLFLVSSLEAGEQNLKMEG
jgi:hypothetical protein